MIKELFEQFEDREVKMIVKDKELLFEVYSTGMALGYITNAKGKSYPHKTRIDKVLENAEISTVVHDVQQYITESQLYDFMLEAKTEKCKSFRKWITDIVLPTLRKDGIYLDGEENITSQDELIKLGYEALMQKCERLEKQLTKGNVIFYKTNKTYKDVHECAKETGYDVTTIRNHCRGVGGIKDRQFGYVGAVYNGSGELWVRCLNTGEIMATEKYFDKKYDMPHGTTKNICLGKIESFDGLNFIYEEHEKDSTYYYKQG